MTRFLQFLAILLTGLAMVPAGAHLFEMPGKMALGRDAYLTVQSIYAGWSMFGVVLIGALLANLLLAIRLRGDSPAVYLATAGAAAIALTLILFFAFVFPTNKATANWTQIPADWVALRLQWETWHAVNAIITFAGFCSVVLAALMSRR